MTRISLSDLQNQIVRTLERVSQGESFIITLDGRAIAELRPLPGRALRVAELLRRWRRLPQVDPGRLRTDLDTQNGNDGP